MSKSQSDADFAQVRKDWDALEGLLAIEDPENVHLVTLGRLVSRYDCGQNFFMDEIMRVLGFWGMTKSDLQARCRKIWFSGYRPGEEIDNGVGSANDTEAQ